MIIPCPKCQARLNLPEDAAGIEVRCPSCRHAFRATPEIDLRAVEPGQPKRPLEPRPAAAAPQPRDDDRYDPPPRRRPFDDDRYDPPPHRRDFDDDLGLREPFGDQNVLADNAREHTRFAGQVMLAAGFGTLGGLLANRVLAIFQDIDQGLGPNNPEFIAVLIAGTVFRVIVYGPLLLVMLGAGRNLLRLGSRGLINAGIAVSFVVASVLALGLCIDLFRLAALGESSPLLIPQVVIAGLSCAASLTAGILAIRALSEHHVRQYYEIQRDRLRRYRY